MEWLNGLLHSGIAWVLSLIIGIGVVWKFIQKYTPKIKKALKIAEEITSLLNALIDATQDKKITKEELERILKEVQDLQDALKK